MLIGRDDLAESCGKHLCIGILLFDFGDHALEALYLGIEILSAGFGAFEAEAELEVFLIADQNVRNGGELCKCFAQLLFTAFPEGRTVVEVEADQCPVFLRCPCHVEAALCRVFAHRRDKSGDVQDTDAFFAEDAVKVEI